MGSNNLETIITMNELGLQDSLPYRSKKKNINNNQAKAIKELSSNADLDQHNRMVVSNLENMRLRGEITEKTARYLVTEEPRTPQLYLLPKIDKNITPIPGRPIVSARQKKYPHSWTTFCHPLSRSYIRDTGDFMWKLQEIDNLTGYEIRLTLDVSALYTNIPNEEGTTVVRRTRSLARPGDTQPSNLSLVKLLAQVLSLNNFQFDGQNYL